MNSIRWSSRPEDDLSNSHTVEWVPPGALTLPEVSCSYDLELVKNRAARILAWKVVFKKKREPGLIGSLLFDTYS